jgi:hypothetical protein
VRAATSAIRRALEAMAENVGQKDKIDSINQNLYEHEKDFFNYFYLL